MSDKIKKQYRDYVIESVEKGIEPMDYGAFLDIKFVEEMNKFKKLRDDAFNVFKRYGLT